MSDDLPGFIDDEPQPKRAEPAAPPAKGFNAFADVDVDAPTPLKPAAAPAAGKPAAKAAPAPSAEPAKGFNAFADTSTSAAAQADADADIKPGQARDLWACPHCGAKNKPDRTTCRACGKSPQDEVVTPFMQTPAGRFGIPAAVVVVVILLGWMLFGGSVDLVSPTVGNIDSSVRTGGSVGGEGEVAGMIFQPKTRTAVCGRVVAIGTKAGIPAYVLALGSDGRHEEAWRSCTVEFSATPPSLTPELKHVVVYAFGHQPDIAVGGIISLIGDGGVLIRDGRIADDFAGGTVLRVQQSDP